MHRTGPCRRITARIARATPTTPAALATVTLLLLALTVTTAERAVAVTRPSDPGELTLIDTAMGRVLADKDGYALYLRQADAPNQPGCTGACAVTWPAATGRPTRARGVAAPTSVTPLSAVGSTERQVVFGTHPLYYFRSDRPRRPEGQHVPGFSLVSANGTAVAPGASAAETASSTSRPKPKPTQTQTRPPTRTSTRTPTPKPKTSKPPPKPSPPTPETPRTTPAATRSPAPATVGALRVTPSGAARGGADHPAAAATAVPPSGRSAVAELALAIGATAAASAGTILLVRRLQRRATGGEH
ncbi:hypothetical protein [Streptomyces sp. NPDC093109]|uniref:hypothetical protein n=1 Tax=Streptomyces sp. NPDC093109 TaxID=3154977 RepID=UPI00344CE52D